MGKKLQRIGHLPQRRRKKMPLPIMKRIKST